MTPHKNALFRCRRGIKACQSVHAAFVSSKRLLAESNSTDHEILSCLFSQAVIKYAKPFTPANSNEGKITYPVSQLKAAAGFSMKTHSHIIEIRNTLIAHDDFTMVMPRLVAMGIKLSGSNTLIPLSITMTNKCVSHPVEVKFLREMTTHIEIALKAICAAFFDDLGELRVLTIKHPEEAERESSYTQNYGSGEIPATGGRLNVPDYSQDPWLQVPEPDFSEIHAGFRYDTMTLRREFAGEEEIELPEGTKIVIKPSES
jgi:hypothetical protein